MEKSERTIYEVIVGDLTYKLGVGGIKLIEVSPPLLGVLYEDGHALGAYFPDEKMFWLHRETKIIVPSLDTSEIARVS